MKTNQTLQVVNAMKKSGGFSTFGKLNSLLDFSSWKTKTPEASVRSIVQNDKIFFKIKPGLWALKEFESDIINKLNLDKNSNSSEDFNHSYYQGLAVEIGNLKNFNTYVPNQDKNKCFLDKPLKEIANITDIYSFSYPEIVKYAKTVDVIWFNERKMPCTFFEIEHTTDIKNSLIKYFELQDFNANFYIIAEEHKRVVFNELINRTIFKNLEKRVQFRSYETLSDIHSIAFKESLIENL